jgi:hypothetical protein
MVGARQGARVPDHASWPGNGDNPDLIDTVAFAYPYWPGSPPTGWVLGQSKTRMFWSTQTPPLLLVLAVR